MKRAARNPLFKARECSVATATDGCTAKGKNSLQFFIITFLVLLIAGLFILASVFWAKGSTFNGQSATQFIAQSMEQSVIQSAAQGMAEDSGVFTGESMSAEDASREESGDSEYPLSRPEGEDTSEANVEGEVLATDDTSFAATDEAASDEGTATSEESAEAFKLQAARGDSYLVPLTDAAPRLDPVPPGAVGVSSMSALNTQIQQANAGNVSYIFLTQNISGSLGTNINAAGLLNNGEGLTIDGRGHRWNCDQNSGNSTIRVQGGSNPRAFTLKNVDIISSGGTLAGDNSPTISFSTGSGEDSNSEAANSRFWTINLHSVRSVNSAGNPAAANRGLIALSDGEVNFSGTNFWHLVQRRTLVNARMVNFDGGQTELRITRTDSVRGSVARRMLLIRAQPSTDAAREMGAGVTLTNGAQVTLNRQVNSGSSARQGYTIRINSGALSSEAQVRPAVLNLDGGSSLTVIGNPRGDGSTVSNNGVISISGGSGGVNVRGGSELLAHNTRRGTGSSAGTSALIQQIRGGVFNVDGKDSKATFISESAEHRRQSTLRFYMRGGVSNQVVSVTDGAELNIERRRTGGDRNASALRFGQGTGNGFYVHNATVNIHNAGTNTTYDPGTGVARGFNVGVDFAANNWFFRVLGDSDMQIHAERGAAINARGHSNGEITVTQGANFTAMGRTASTGTDAAVIRATGGNVHFNMDGPQFYDFVNVRPGGGRVFALGPGGGNTFTSTNSDVAVWRRGINVWNEEPDRRWTLIDFRLTGAQLRNVDESSSYSDFASYYNTAPSTRRMENYTRIMGNNSRPVINETLDLTNADRHVRALAETPQGRIREPRPVWTGELWGKFTHVCSLTDDVNSISSTDTPLGALVSSFYTENLYEVETDAKSIEGSLRMTHEDGRYLRAGDLYRVDSAWRACTPDLPRNHQAVNLPPSINFEAVRDVVPPLPVTVDEVVVPVHQTEFGGHWTLEDKFDDGPLIGSDGIRIYAQNGTEAPRRITGSGFVSTDNRWTFDADAGQLRAGDFAWASLADKQDPPNWNPIQPTPVRDRMIPEASWFIVSLDGMMPVVAQYFFEGIEYIPYRFTSQQLIFPNPGEIRTANMGAGASSDTHLYFPSQPRQGYMVDRIDLLASDGGVTTIDIGPDGYPLEPFEVSPQEAIIHVHYILDPEARSNLMVEFRFADFGGTNAQSWTLQAAVPYPEVRTGTYAASGRDRFPRQMLGDYHVTETLTYRNVLALIDTLFEAEYDPDTGEVLVLPEIDGLPRGFVPCPDNHIQLPIHGSGASAAQLTFPVRVADVHNAHDVVAGVAERRPIIINYVATLETVEISQSVERCPDLLGSQPQRNLFDNMSFNYQIALYQARPGGLAAGVDPWRDHRLEVTIHSERAEPPEGSDAIPAWADYIARTWHGGGTGNINGAIRIGTWNQSDAGTADSGSGSGPSNTVRGNRRTNAEETISIAQVPSTAYIAVTQQINSGSAGTNNTASNNNTDWMNGAIHSRHERDFEDSITDQVYLWPPSTRHLSNDSTADNTLANNIHTTNWANPLPTDNNPHYEPGRPMINAIRDFHFRVKPQSGFMLTVVNQVDGDDADMERARHFSVQLKDAAGNYLADRELGLWLGEYYDEFMGIDSESGDRIYEPRRVMTSVEVGENGTVTDDLPPLLPGESFTLMRVGGMYQARVTMLDFPGHEDYEVHNYFVREREGIPSDALPGMTSEFASFNRDYLEFVFESYREEPRVTPSGLLAGSTAIIVLALGTVGVGGAIASLCKRRAIERLVKNCPCEDVCIEP